MDCARIPGFVVGDTVRLQRCIDHAASPPGQADDNLIVGSWNIRDFGAFHSDWTENPCSPKRNFRGLVLIAQIIQCFDVIASQEVKRDVGVDPEPPPMHRSRSTLWRPTADARREPIVE